MTAAATRKLTMPVREIERAKAPRHHTKGDAVLQCPNCTLTRDVAHDDLAEHWPAHCGVSMRVLYSG